MTPSHVADAITWYVVFLFSVTFHEAAHAWTARRGGDSTAYAGGQLTIDPIPHIRREPIGMVLAPLLTLATLGWPLGWASAPLDPFWAQRHPRRAAWVSLAGPLSNLVLVLAAAAAIWIGIAAGVFRVPMTAHRDHVVQAVSGGMFEASAFVLSCFFYMNLVLFAFNLIPLPPMDGAGALPLLLPESAAERFAESMRSPMLSLFGIYLAWKVFPAIFGPLFTLALNVLYPGSRFG
ncbi:MAG TPA: site-2 protease family protein [Myxococcota bacterium]|jgi:Zn-dependent protease|nr:site-2 protease family protein [Myxococcota bacterium]